MLDSYVLTLPFWATHPSPPYSESNHHKGIDLARPGGGGEGDPVYCAAEGEVVFAAPSGWGEHGIHVRVDHGSGWATWYSHLSRLDVLDVLGGHVEAGQVLGSIGHSGLATDDHLHWQCMFEGVPVDPEELLA